VGDPDNDFLALAKLTGYQFQGYEKKEENEKKAAVFHVMATMAKFPELLEMVIAQASGKPIDQAEFLKRLAAQPEALNVDLRRFVCNV
jgi:hypothetical protein